MKTLYAADLFCGAGGTSTALAMACGSLGRRLRLTAVNHWPVALETHAANHPGAEHVCETLDSVDPRKLFPGRLDVLCASPECTHHSNARGGKPCSDQSRATAWHVVRWAEALRPRVILVENVRELLTWGPLGSNGRPLKSRRGAIYSAWVAALEATGYRVSHRLVNAADFGGATTRTRLFVVAVRGRGPVPWPSPTHERDPRPALFGKVHRWRAAAEVIDWSLAGRSVFGRKKPLAENTVRRIAEGIRRFWGVDPAPFLVRLRGTSDAHVASSALPVTSPIPTLTAGRNIGLCEPFIVPRFSSNEAREIDRPLGGITTTTRGMGLVEPFLSVYHNGPDGDRRNLPAAAPLPTLDTSNRVGLVSPFLVKYNGTGGPLSVGEPLDTVTAVDRFGLVLPSGAVVSDVLFRMLQPHELAAGMGFPAGYVFKGTREQVVKQIGNAVEVNVARAHLAELVRYAGGAA